MKANSSNTVTASKAPTKKVKKKGSPATTYAGNRQRRQVQNRRDRRTKGIAEIGETIPGTKSEACLARKSRRVARRVVIKEEKAKAQMERMKATEAAKKITSAPKIRPIDVLVAMVAMDMASMR